MNISNLFDHSNYGNPFSEFIILFAYIFTLTGGVLFTLPWIAEGIVRSIDKAFGGNKKPTPYNYKPEELWEQPAHWKNWKKNETT